MGTVFPVCTSTSLLSTSICHIVTGSPPGYRIQEAAPTPVVVETNAAGDFVYPGDLQPGVVPVTVMARGFPVWEGTATIPAGEASSNMR